MTTGPEGSVEPLKLERGSREPPTLESTLETAESARRAGEWDEALAQFEVALQLVPEEDVGRTADIWRSVGKIHFERGATDRAERMFRASLSLAEEHGLPQSEAFSLNCLAIVEQFSGRTESAESCYHRARTLADQADNHRLVAMVDQNLGTLANIQGDHARALRSYSSALERFRRLDDELAAARALSNMALTHTDLEEPDAANRCLDEAFQLANRVRDTGTLGSVELNRAKLHISQSDFRAARESCDRAFEIFSRMRSSRWLAETHKFYGVLYRETDKPHLADNHLSQAADLGHGSGNHLVEAEAHAEWALVHLTQDKNKEALGCLNRAHRLFSELHASRELLDIDRRLDDLESTYLRVVRAWGEAIESQDRYTAGHCERVADYTLRIARALGIEGRDLTWLHMGAFLHDVGKTEVPTEVLNKPGKLTDQEWELMKRHTVVGDEIVTELEFPWEIRPIVRSHHEHWDGSGYPDGLAGEEIPLHARILCVADVYDALTTARSYRPALPKAEALRIMERDAGELLDPELFEIFRDLVTADGHREPEAEASRAQPADPKTRRPGRRGAAERGAA